MRPDYCPVANEPCQAMCLDGCRLRERSYYVAELEKERRQLQTMLHQERTETEALRELALEIARLSYLMADAHARKRGEQTGLDTLVVHALNDVD